MREFHHHQAVYVLGVLDLFRVWKTCFLKQPVVVLLDAPLLAPEQVSTPEHGNFEIIFYIVYGTVRRKRTVWNEDSVHVSHFFLALRFEDLIEPCIDICMIHDSADEFTVLPPGFEVFCVRPLAAFLTYSVCTESFFHRAVAYIKCRMGCQNPDRGFIEIVSR